jgi:Na+-driven multidrug efflux pump
MDNRESILRDNIGKLIVKMSLPGIAGMLVISINSLVDAVFAGRFIGADAIAGISLSIPLLVVNSAVTGFISSGAANVLSRAIGARNQAVFDNLFFYVSAFALTASALLGFLGYHFGGILLRLMGAEGNILSEATSYYSWMMAGCFTSIFGLSISSLLRAEGQMKYAMSITTFAVLLNIALNAFLVVYLGKGVKGSALATVVSMGVFCILTLRYFFTGKSHIRPALLGRAYLPEMVAEMSSVGLSALIMQLNNFLRQIFLFKTVTWYNNAAEISFFSAVFRIFSFSVIPIFGMLQAMQPIVGINFGAGKLIRAVSTLRYFRWACIGLMLLILIPLLVFSPQVLSLILPGMSFTPDDIFRFRLLMCVLPIAPVASTAVVFMQATGKGKITSYLALGREIVLFIPIMFFLPYIQGPSGIYYGLLLENLIYMLVVLYVLHSQVKKMFTLEKESLTVPII